VGIASLGPMPLSSWSSKPMQGSVFIILFYFCLRCPAKLMQLDINFPCCLFFVFNCIAFSFINIFCVLLCSTLFGNSLVELQI
jgi:hypothetical protein